MGSVRNPVGPLPSSIYWRRRVVAACLFALLVAVAVWGYTAFGGGGGGGDDGKGSSAPVSSHTPIASITAGPAPTGTHISGEPGGRDTAPPDSSAGGAANGGTGDGTSGGSSAGSGSSAGDTSGTSGTAGTSSGAGSGSSGSTTGGPVAAGSTLPDCSPGPVTLTLSSVQNSYEPGQDPEFVLRATNSGAVSCKVDFGPKSAVFTVTRAADNSHVWASDDCPTTGARFYQVPAHSFASFTLRWNARTSSPQCAKPKGQLAAPGTYLVQAQVSGYGTRQVSFVLSED